jgi:hypothetical protein
MAALPPERISDELLETTGKLYWHVPLLAWNARVPSGVLLSRGAPRRRGARVRRARGIRQLFDVSHLAWCLPSLGGLSPTSIHMIAQSPSASCLPFSSAWDLPDRSLTRSLFLSTLAVSSKRITLPLIASSRFSRSSRIREGPGIPRCVYSNVFKSLGLASALLYDKMTFQKYFAVNRMQYTRSIE